MRYLEILKERYQLIIRYIGILIMGVAIFLLLPLLSLPFYPEEIKYSYAFLVPAIIIFIIGYIACRCQHANQAIRKNLSGKIGNAVD